MHRVTDGEGAPFSKKISEYAKALLHCDVVSEHKRAHYHRAGRLLEQARAEIVRANDGRWRGDIGDRWRVTYSPHIGGLGGSPQSLGESKILREAREVARREAIAYCTRHYIARVKDLKMVCPDDPVIENVHRRQSKLSKRHGRLRLAVWSLFVVAAVSFVTSIAALIAAAS